MKHRDINLYEADYGPRIATHVHFSETQTLALQCARKVIRKLGLKDYARGRICQDPLWFAFSFSVLPYKKYKHPRKYTLSIDFREPLPPVIIWFNQVVSGGLILGVVNVIEDEKVRKYSFDISDEYRRLVLYHWKEI